MKVSQWPGSEDGSSHFLDRFSQSKKVPSNYIYIFQELQLVEVLKLEMKLVFVIEEVQKFKFYDLYGNLVPRKCPFSFNTIGITAI